MTSDDDRDRGRRRHAAARRAPRPRGRRCSTPHWPSSPRTVSRAPPPARSPRPRAPISRRSTTTSTRRTSCGSEAVDHLFARLDDAVGRYLRDTTVRDWATRARLRRRHPSVRPRGRRAPRTEPDHGAGGDDRLRSAALDRGTSHPPAVRAADHATGETCAPRGEVPDVDEVVLYYSLVGAASLAYVNAPEARLLGHDTQSASFIDAHADALVTLFLGGPA